MKCMISMLVLVTCGGAMANNVKEKSFYGAEISLAQPMSLDRAVSGLQSDKSEEILLQAKVEKVCSKKGCWMALTSQQHQARVTFKDYGFFASEFAEFFGTKKP